ncbi:ActD-like protein [Melittangium boletus]|uniref:ActD-like protein n=1 Tax=Melittangium boletus DSM 14713 TaxID=1294270 RepID=A0A250IQ87_9BACT|nr:ActD-like protein [Melittangium boletus]ATB33915.1 hypothetical protein MEBOL_007416 [Melittangium boletus DSM 14713]
MSTPHRTPDWLLERIALGELPPDELAEARARLAREPDGDARLAALEAENQALLARRPPAAVAREVEVRARRASPERRLLPALALVPVLAGLALLMVPPDPAPVGMSGGDSALTEVTRAKGLRPRLLVHRDGASGPEELAEKTLAQAGDVVQLSYVAGDAAYGAILSVDGRGVVTLHAPESGASALPLSSSGAHALPHAYALDDAPAFERFFFITSDQPFALEPVLAAARDLAASDDAHLVPLALPPGLGQTSFTLEKSAP